MAEQKRGSYTPEFRQKAADLAMTSDVKVADIAKTLNVVPSTLSNWVARRKQQLKASSVESPPSTQCKTKQTTSPPSQSASQQSELERLEREVKRLQQERKVVKEAILLMTT